MQKNRKSIQIIGELGLDISEFNKNANLLTLGTPCLNVALQLIKKGFNIKYYSALSNDSISNFLRRQLADIGFDTSRITKIDSAQVPLIRISDGKSKIIDSELEFVPDKYLSQINKYVKYTEKFLVVSPHLIKFEGASKYLDTIMDKNNFVACDLNFARNKFTDKQVDNIFKFLKKYGSIVKCSSEDLSSISLNEIDFINSLNKNSLVAITHGQFGYALYSNNYKKLINITPLKYNGDYFGTGDVFFSYMIEWSIQNNLKYNKKIDDEDIEKFNSKVIKYIEEFLESKILLKHHI